MWERYCRGVNAIVYVVDASDQAKLPASKAELHSLIEKPVLAQIPLLVLANKNDVEGALDVGQIIEAFGLDSLRDR